jgi:hypothetical protein
MERERNEGQDCMRALYLQVCSPSESSAQDGTWRFAQDRREDSDLKLFADWQVEGGFREWPGKGFGNSGKSVNR